MLLRSGNLCDNGAVELTIDELPAEDPTIQWLRLDSASSGYVEIPGKHDLRLKVTSRGDYEVIAQTASCKSTSEPLTVNDRLLLSLDPAENHIKACHGSTATLTFGDETMAEFSWFYHESPGATPTVLNEHQPTLEAGKSGYYYAIASRGICKMVSPEKQIEILPADSVFIPNVFSPNGDSWNNEFRVISTNHEITFYVFNRDGKRIYQGNNSHPWNGGSAPSGIYYWYAAYPKCEGGLKVLKGTVQLIR